jgi:hypothetical protein
MSAALEGMGWICRNRPARYRGSTDGDGSDCHHAALPPVLTVCDYAVEEERSAPLTHFDGALAICDTLASQPALRRIVYGVGSRVSFKPRPDYRLIVSEMTRAG